MNGMRTVAAALILLGAVACESTPEESATAGSGGPTTTMPGAGGTSSFPPGGGSGGYSSAPLGGSGGVQRGSLGAAEVERELVSVGDTVYFGYDSYSLDDRAQETLNRQAALLLRNTAVRVTIEGHADERGTREYNLALGERRATAVKDYLIAFGVTPGRMVTISYGEERPAVAGSSESAWAKNRRVVTVVTGAAGS